MSTAQTTETLTVALSSGFLAFARHIGVVAALQARGVRPTRIVGVSSGSVVGALWAAGLGPREMRAFLGDERPLRSLRPRFFLGASGPGLLSLDRLVTRLRAVLPARVEDLPIPFAAGVVRRRDAACWLVDTGDLPELLAASCAMPWIFGPRRVHGEACVDGGAQDRLFLRSSLETAPTTRTIAHVVEASAVGREHRGRLVEGQLEWAATRTALTVVRTPRSGASFWSLGPVDAQIAEADAAARRALAGE